MSTAERAEDFKKAIEQALGTGALVSGPSLGISNRARVDLSHLLVGVPNLSLFLGGLNFEDFASERHSAWATTSCLCPLIGIEIHIGVATDNLTSTKAVRNKIHEIAERRVAVSQSRGHNNTMVGISNAGELVVGIGKEDDLQSAGVKPDKFFVAVYPSDDRTRLNPAVQEFIGSIRELIGEDKVHRMDLWDSTSITDEMRRMPSEIGFERINKSIEALGGCYPEDLLRQFHNGLNYHARKHFVILSGVSGTGKSSLAQRYAWSVHGLKGLADSNPLFFWCRVRPDWTDPSGLLGHFDVFSGKYTVPPFLEALLTAEAYPTSPVFVCLDEMNLARVEYYLADVLSVMETPDSRLQLHTNAKAYDGDSGVKVPKSTRWPVNLFIVGTINVDETTTVPSPKVLDRAVVVDMSEINVGEVMKSLCSKQPAVKWAADLCETTLTNLLNVLKEHQLGFGYRAIEEVVQYVVFASDETHSNGMSLLDEQINQKILTKLRGTTEQAPMLEELEKIFDGFKTCMQTLRRIGQELTELGSFQAMR